MTSEPTQGLLDKLAAEAEHAERTRDAALDYQQRPRDNSGVVMGHASSKAGSADR